MLDALILLICCFLLLGQILLSLELRSIRRLLAKEPQTPALFRMIMGGEHRTLTLPEAIQHWRFERSKHAPGSSMWRAYNQKLFDVGYRD